MRRVYSFDLPAGLSPRSLVAANVLDRLTRAMPGASIDAVRVGRYVDAKTLAVDVIAVVPDGPPGTDPSFDPRLERFAAAVRRLYGPDAARGVSCWAGDRFDEEGHVARRIPGGGYRVQHETPTHLNRSTP